MSEESGVNWIDVVRRHWPDVSPKDACALLWNATAFPFADEGYIDKQLRNAALASDRNVDRAINQAEVSVWRTMRDTGIDHSNDDGESR